MALSLPYPGMTFVPLDTLSAEELNHIVANYTYISNQFPVSAANIANGSITAQKVSSNFIIASTTDPGDGAPWPNSDCVLYAVVG